MERSGGPPGERGAGPSGQLSGCGAEKLSENPGLVCIFDLQYNQNMGKLKVRRYDLKSRKCGPQGNNLGFVFISDLHNGVYGPDNRGLMELVRSQEPDAVLIGGDQIVAKPGYPLEPGLMSVKMLAEEFPVYYACGNHEYRLKLYPEVYGDAYDRLREGLAKTKAVYLENQTASFRKNGLRVLIYGFEMKKEYYERFSRRELPVTELTDVFGTPPEDALSVLLAHHPGYADTYERFGADITLSGHYHGGVVGFGTRGLVSPDFRLFPKNCHGCFEKNGTYRIISAGCGEHTVPFRIHNPRELVVLDVT